MANDQFLRARRSLLLGLLLSLMAGCVANPPPPVQGKPGGQVELNAPAQSSPSAASSNPSLPPPASVTRDLHPSGPTVVRTWRSSAEAQPDRIELTHARSGRRLVGQARLLRQSTGQWIIQTTAGEQLPVSGNVTPSTVIFEESDQRWRVRVLKQNEPVIRPGIATEGEPNLDLMLERLP